MIIFLLLTTISSFSMEREMRDLNFIQFQESAHLLQEHVNKLPLRIKNVLSTARKNNRYIFYNFMCYELPGLINHCKDIADLLQMQDLHSWGTDGFKLAWEFKCINFQIMCEVRSKDLADDCYEITSPTNFNLPKELESDRHRIRSIKYFEDLNERLNETDEKILECLDRCQKPQEMLRKVLV